MDKDFLPKRLFRPAEPENRRSLPLYAACVEGPVLGTPPWAVFLHPDGDVSAPWLSAPHTENFSFDVTQPSPTAKRSCSTCPLPKKESLYTTPARRLRRPLNRSFIRPPSSGSAESRRWRRPSWRKRARGFTDLVNHYSEHSLISLSASTRFAQADRSKFIECAPLLNCDCPPHGPETVSRGKNSGDELRRGSATFER